MPVRVVIQAGHQNTQNNIDPDLRGSTGAPGEVNFTVDVANQVSAKLRQLGFEVKQTDANANADPAITTADWDLFLAIHYEADVHNTNGYFVAAPDPSTDAVNGESVRIRDIINSEYLKLGIPNHPEWQNPKTKFYYMWRALSTKTPCVLIECGVGWRVPKDSDLLNSITGRPKVVEIIVSGICKAFSVPYSGTTSLPNVPETSSNSQADQLVSQIKQILYGKGWPWSKLNKIKVLLPK